MKLSIITINLNNASGLEKTMKGVMEQSRQDFEYLVIDGGSTDGSIEVIKKYENAPNLRWISEKDNGIYNAMNKGIRMAEGDYLHFLNSGDCLMNPQVVEKMLAAAEENGDPDILIGNEYFMAGSKPFFNTVGITDHISLGAFFEKTIRHQSAYIKRKLFDKYGLYDENLKIASDWKWFMQAIIFGNANSVYVDVDVDLFDTNGISSAQDELRLKEHALILKETVPPQILADYINHRQDVEIMQRIRHRRLAYKIVKKTYLLICKQEERELRRLLNQN